MKFRSDLSRTHVTTKNKAEALQKRIAYLNAWHRETIRYEGGIARLENGMWYYNDNETYHYQAGSTEGWKKMNDLFRTPQMTVVEHKSVEYLDIDDDAPAKAAEDIYNE